MIIFNKKRILFIMLAVIVSVIVPYLLENNDETIETVALPVSNKVIVLDAGHGTPDERSRKFKWNN